MQNLVRGIHQFQKTIFADQRELFERLSHGQRPDALFVTCSDSRINPNLLTQTEPGELFILRNAGNIIPPHGTGPTGEAATIEYAVSALGVQDIIVCGHSHCGAMTALVQPELLAQLPATAAWLGFAEETRTIVRRNYENLLGDALLMATVQENVLVQLEHLRTHPSVASRIEKGELHLHGWVYKIATGEVFAYDDEKCAFVPVTQAPKAPSASKRSGSI